MNGVLSVLFLFQRDFNGGAHGEGEIVSTPTIGWGFRMTLFGLGVCGAFALVGFWLGRNGERKRAELALSSTEDRWLALVCDQSRLPRMNASVQKFAAGLDQAVTAAQGWHDAGEIWKRYVTEIRSGYAYQTGTLDGLGDGSPEAAAALSMKATLVAKYRESLLDQFGQAVSPAEGEKLRQAFKRFEVATAVKGLLKRS